MRLADTHDGLILDLDGTVYLGRQPIPHVVDALAAAAERGARAVYLTNNASRPPTEVAAQLVGMGLPAEPSDVLTSPQAAAALLAERHQPGDPVLVVGAAALVDEVAAVGLRPVRTAAENPVAVVQGHSPETGWPILAEACIALLSGIDWVAANLDPTLPTDRGLLPGNGSMVAALVTATGLHPRVAGKPAPALVHEAVRRFGFHRPLVIGDRLDTDIEAGNRADVPSLLVMTGVTTVGDLRFAKPEHRPTYLAFDLRGLVDQTRAVAVRSAGAGWELHADHAVATLNRTAPPDADPEVDDLQAMALIMRASWAGGTHQLRAGDPAASRSLTRLGIVHE